MKRAANAAYWAIPSLFCLALYWLGLRAWFQHDDFAWLSLNLRLRESGSLLDILFGPQAQGTIRPLSERAFFLVFHGIFGLNALPFRITVFLTQFANLILISSITWRLTRSRAAGFCAPVLWISNGVLATVMSWTSAYNQALCAFFLLASFWLLLRHIETGMARYQVLQWFMFLMGLGALELSVVYPAVAASYTFLLARRHFRRTLWLFVPSAAYLLLHWHLAHMPEAGPYRMYFDAQLGGTLWTYWQWALAPARIGHASLILPAWLLMAATLSLTLALLGFAANQTRRRDWLAAFLLIWFLLLIAPVLPLRDHVSDYYLTVPAIPLAMLGAWALVRAWNSRWPLSLAATLSVAVYLSCSLPVARAATRWNFEISRSSRNLVLGLVRARELHPKGLILLTGIDSDLFWGVMYHRAYRVAGVQQVYLAPGAEESISPRSELAEVSDWVLPPAATIRALEQERAVVYLAQGGILRNVTRAFRDIARARWARPELPWKVDVANPLFAAQLGPAWYAIDGSHRWMPQRATVSLRGPRTSAEKLHLAGFTPRQQVVKRPLRVTASVEGLAVGSALLSRPDELFELSFSLPNQLVGRERVEVTVEVDRTFVVPPDRRELGLVFGSISIR